MSSSDSHVNQILSNITIYIYRYGSLLVYLLGNIGNVISAYVFLKKTWRKNVCVFYFLICLLLNSIYVNSTILAFMFLMGYSIGAQNSNIILCKLFYYISMLLITLYPTILICASIDRLLISSQKVDTRLYSSKRLAYFLISISTCFWLLFNIHALIKINIQTYPQSPPLCYYDSTGGYSDFVRLVLMVVNIFFWLIMFILCTLSFKNVRRIRCIPREKRSQQIRVMKKKDFQLLRCLFALNCVYVIVNIGSNVYTIFITITKYQEKSPLELTIRSFINSFNIFFAHTSHWSSFFIFLMISKAFRFEIKQMINRIFRRELFELHPEQNNERNDIEVAAISNQALPS